MAIKAALILYIIVFGAGVGAIEFSLTIAESWEDFITPWSMHRRWEHMNWFGCWVIFIILSVLSPIMFVIKLITFLFSVGRNPEDKDEE